MVPEWRAFSALQGSWWPTYGRKYYVSGYPGNGDWFGGKPLIARAYGGMESIGTKKRPFRKWLAWLLACIGLSVFVLYVINASGSVRSEATLKFITDMESTISLQDVSWMEFADKLEKRGFVIRDESHPGFKEVPGRKEYIAFKENEVSRLNVMSPHALTNIALAFYRLQVNIMVENGKITKISHRPYYYFAL